MSTLSRHSSQYLTDVAYHLECNRRVLNTQPAGRPLKGNTCPPRGILESCSLQHCSQDGLQHPLSMDVKHLHGLICLRVHSEIMLDY